MDGFDGAGGGPGLLGLVVRWINEGRFPRDEFTIRWRRVGIGLAVGVGALIVLVTVVALSSS